MGVMSHERAAELKKQAEIDFLTFKVEQTNKAVDAAISAFGQETNEYKKAKAAQIQAELELQNTIKRTSETLNEQVSQIKKTTAAITESASAYRETSISARKANESIKNTTKTSKNSGNTILSISSAMSQSMADLKSLGLESAAALLGIDEIYAKLVKQVRALGGETKNLNRMTLNEIQKYIDKIDEASGKEINVNFTGTGSSKKPLSEKLSEMGKRVADFTMNIPKQIDQNINYSMGWRQEQTVPRGTSGFDQVKDMGKINLNVGTKEIPVYSEQNILDTLKLELRREGLSF